jgi:branched-chain amino acid transport system ATP-binding protein
MLELIDVHTYYGDSHILQGISFNVVKENIIALIGRNGVGKTTTVHTIVGFCQPSSGRILFEGRNIAGLPAHQITSMGLSLIPQGRRLFPSLTVREHLEISARKWKRENYWDTNRVFRLFPGLKKRHKRRSNMLSGGEQQMLAIARALVANPRLLLMDEPSEGLAPILVQEVFHVVQELKSSGLAILLVEQNVKAALQVADYVYVMSKGSIVHASSSDQLQNDHEIQSKYLGV